MQILQQLQRHNGTWVELPQKPLPEPGLPMAWSQGFPSGALRPGARTQRPSGAQFCGWASTVRNE